MRIEKGGAIPAQPDFEMLRAGLTAAQAATPTALASLRTRGASDRAEALLGLFGDVRLCDRAVLRGSFHPLAVEQPAAPKKVTTPFTLALKASFNAPALNGPTKGNEARGGEREE